MSRPLVAYADLHGHPLAGPLLALAAAPDDPAAAAAAARAAFAADPPLARTLALAVVGSAGPFAVAARRGLPDDDPRRALAAAELRALGELARGDAARLLARHGLEHAVGTDRSNATDALPPAARALTERLAGTEAWAPLAGELAAFHRAEGAGALAVHRVLRWVNGALVGVAEPDRIALADLAGGEEQRAPLVGDLDALADGQSAPDALLYGPPGTGKSAAVRACAAAAAERGVRLVQVERDQLDGVDGALAALADGPPCVLFLDDLVIDDGERLDRALRATLDGGVAARPANVLVWATSNRLSLMQGSRVARADDVDAEETVAERAALAARFGRRIRFPRQDKAAYLAICRHLARARLGALPDDLDAQALRFAVQGHGLSARTARQFADQLR